MPMPMPMPAPKVNSITWCRCQCQLLKSKPAPETNAITWCQCRPLLQSCPLDTLLLQQGSHSHCRHQGPWEQRDQSRNESAAQTTCLQQAVAAARIPQPLPICHACMPWTTSCMHAVNNVMHACREQCHACMPWTMSCMPWTTSCMHACREQYLCSAAYHVQQVPIWNVASKENEWSFELQTYIYGAMRHVSV